MDIEIKSIKPCLATQNKMILGVNTKYIYTGLVCWKLHSADEKNQRKRDIHLHGLENSTLKRCPFSPNRSIGLMQFSSIFQQDIL